jgi:hypothetical protein
MYAHIFFWKGDVHINFEMTQGDGGYFWPHVPVITRYACARAQAYLSAETLVIFPHLRVLDNKEKSQLANYVLSHLLSSVYKTCS